MDEEKKSASRIKKEETVETLFEKLERANAVLLTDYRGLNAAQVTELKKKLTENEAEMTVAKNSLLSIAAKKAGYEVPPENLTGPTSIIFAYGDQITPIKEVANFIKSHELPRVKVGFLEKSLYEAARIMELAKLPSREVLLGQVVSSISAPLYGLNGVLSANLRNLVYTLEQIRLKGGAN